MKARCSKCKQMATWVYGPSYRRSSLYCEEHVPRLCSCQVVDISDNFPSGHPQAEPLRDRKGRLLPCVEYDREEEGWDEDEFLGDDD